MEHEYSITYNRVLLRPLKLEDIEKLRILRNKEKQYFLNTAEISKEQQIKWFENYLKKDNDIMFTVENVNRRGVFIGAIALYNIELENRTAEFGRTVIDKEVAPESGLGMEATRAVLLFGLKQLKLNRIVADVIKSNQRILKVDLRAGCRIASETDDLYVLEITSEALED